MNSIKHFFIAFFTYLLVDILYQVLIGYRLMTHFYESAGISDIFTSPEGLGLALVLLFFILIALANLKLVIEPSIKEKNLRK